MPGGHAPVAGPLPSIVDALRREASVFGAELRPPRAELGDADGMDAWIDMYHAVRRLTRGNVHVFLTDSAVGTQEENNLRHVVTNLGRDLAREQVVPFLTSKHSLEFCLSYAEQARQHGFTSLVVLGGDKTVGRPRCVEHASTLRQEIRKREPRLTLGGWANPHADARQQVDFLVEESFTAEFYLTQIVSHLHVDPVKRFLDEAHRRQVRMPGMFGVFYYRSANRRTLDILSQFVPVPIDALIAEFNAGATAVDICARTIAAMAALGVRHFYVSNLPPQDAAATMGEILSRVQHARLT
jgi:5,10-methylenetetrahydrofolate reductase